MVPCAKTITARHDARFAQHKSDLIEKCSKIRDGSASITRDAWTSVANKNYDCFTLHDVDEDYVMHSTVLAVRQTTGKDGQAIKSSIQSTLDEFGIVDPHVTTDNCSAEILGVREAGLTRVMCQGHTGNSSVKAGLAQEKVESTLNQSRKLCKWFKRSSQSLEVLQTKQAELLPKELQNHTLKNDTKNRWDSTFTMVDRVLEQDIAIQAASRDPLVLRLNDNIQHLVPTSRQRVILQKIQEVVEPFTRATKTLSSDTEVTSSLAIPTAMILDNATKPQPTDEKWLREMKAKMSKNLDKRDTLSHPSLKIASILDPNTKDFITDDKRAILLPLVEQLVTEDFTSASNTLSSNIPDVSPSLTQPDVEPPPKKQKLSDYDWIRATLKPKPVDEDDEPISNLLSDSNGIALKEVTCFLDMPDSTVKPLDYWIRYGPEFPHLAILARKYFGIQATGVPSERLWSCGGNVLHKKTARLSSKHLEAQVMLHLNTTKELKLKSRKRKAEN